MARTRLFWRLFPSYLLITLVSLLTVTWYASVAVRRFYYGQKASDLEATARMGAYHLRDEISPLDRVRVDALCKALGEAGRARLTVVLPTGEVIGDSYENPTRMEDHSQRVEFMRAFAGEVGQRRGFSETLQQDMMYVASPIREEEAVVAAIRASLPTTELQEALGSIKRRIAAVAVLLGLLAGGLSLYAARRLAGPLEEMRRAAQHFARGELHHQLPVPASEEMATLARTLNEMAASLGEKIRTVTRQRSELEAMLSSMVEGIIAVDSDERVIRMNAAARKVFDIRMKGVRGQPIQEIIRNSRLQRLLLRTMESEEVEEDEIVLHRCGERYLRARGMALRDAEGRHTGALVMLNDVTRMRRLENMRRDFVANVSHELRTPVTAIKGFAESMLEHPGVDPEKAPRFLQIIADQADRLNALIEDLLALSRLEDREDGGMQVREAPIGDVLATAAQTCRILAEQKDINIKLDCPQDVIVHIDPSLLEQAVVNLIDNAIKYSPEGARVRVSAEKNGDRVQVRVRDSGPGIEQEHLPRLFERFYRVDKARSREAGGTGLGLAIVKHVARAHGGTVEVQSTPGQGSTFTIDLPA